jgi:uncharacterized protein YcbK (DUF882 family)
MRLFIFPLAVVLGLPFAANVQAGSASHEVEQDDTAEGSAAAAPEVAPKAIKASSKSKSKAKATKRRKSRHKAQGYAVAESRLLPAPLPPPSGNLHLVNLGSTDDLKVNIYNEDGSYDIEALKSVTHLFRCKRTAAEKDIEPRLLTILSHVYDHYNKPIELLSGFRNQRKTTSYHYKASASDIRVEGVTPKQLRAFVETLDSGGMGIGLYPRSQFVHVDVRPPPSYRWIDYSHSDPDSPDKKPPKGWNKKKAKLRS